ncbi:hypothetical protein GYH30_039148 [Glycine max]|uniref:RNase H type-1 domain-containing protein n=1 Tax=Glycine max TaxID=3847 RepID=A0A0R0GAI4_SOYBN|nr:hypothetical protein GYH30_039148 [Glycine max]
MHKNDFGLRDKLSCERDPYLSGKLLGSVRKVPGVDDIRDLIFNLLQHFQPSLLSKVSITLWAIWKNKNDKVWNGHDATPSISVDLSNQYLAEWQSVRQVSNGQLPLTSIIQEQQWQKPAISFLKCNLDVAIFASDNSGICLCIRDDQATFIKEKTSTFGGVPKPAEAEAWTLYQTLQWTTWLGYQNVFLRVIANQLFTM